MIKMLKCNLQITLNISVLTVCSMRVYYVEDVTYTFYYNYVHVCMYMYLHVSQWMQCVSAMM